MNKLLSSTLLILLIGGFVFVSTLNFGTAQTYTDVTGVLRSDTTWERTNSPYRLTGPVAVNDGITLTIEHGVQIHFNTNTYMQVNGTLVAKGSDEDPISFISDGEIRFMPSSQSWDEQTGTGNIIENGNIPSNEFKITINNASPKIATSHSYAMITVNNGSPLIVNNRLSGHITSLNINDGTPIIHSNRIFDFRIIVEGGSPVIFNNTISPDLYLGVEVTGGDPYIVNNEVNDCTVGISAAYGVIERNHIHGCTIGIEIGNGIIRNNTITASKSISVQAASKPTIIYNNFVNVEGRKNIFLAEGANQDVDAAHNWWGTTDETLINQSIFDSKNDFTLGTVNFVPFITEANPQAMPDPNASIPTSTQIPSTSPSPTATPTITPSPTVSPASTPTPTESPQQTEFTATIGVAIIVAVLSAGLGLLIYLIKRK